MLIVFGKIASVFFIGEEAIYIILAGYALILGGITFLERSGVLVSTTPGISSRCSFTSFISIIIGFVIIMIAPYPLGMDSNIFSSTFMQIGTLGIGFGIFVICYAFLAIIVGIMKNPGEKRQRILERKPIQDRIIEREKLLIRRIPPECFKCGADINPEEVDWIGPDTVRCSHCGASLVVEFERV